jgi:DNA polymerase-4
MRQMQHVNLRSIGDLATLSRVQLRVPFQKRADYLHDISRGKDQSLVLSRQKGDGQIICEHHFDTDICERSAVKDILTLLVHDIGRQLRRRGSVGQRIGIRLFYSDGRSVVRQATCRGGTDNDFSLRELALTALSRAWQRRIRIRNCILICDRLLPRSPQQTLFSMQTKEELQQEKMLAAMDTICRRFGNNAVRLGTS